MTLRLVDTSVWVDFLRAKETPADNAMITLVRRPSSIATTEPVVMELRGGATTPSALRRIESVVGGFTSLGVDPSVDFRTAADLTRAVRASGHTVRSPIDCLIAAVALRRNAILVHKDVGFERIAAIVPAFQHESLR